MNEKVNMPRKQVLMFQLEPKSARFRSCERSTLLIEV